MQLINITKGGRRALRNDTAMTPEHRLLVEIMARVENISVDHLTYLRNATVKQFGSIDAAIIAIKSGAVRFERVTK